MWEQHEGKTKDPSPLQKQRYPQPQCEQNGKLPFHVEATSVEFIMQQRVERAIPVGTKPLEPYFLFRLRINIDTFQQKKTSYQQKCEPRITFCQHMARPLRGDPAFFPLGQLGGSSILCGPSRSHWLVEGGSFNLSDLQPIWCRCRLCGWNNTFYSQFPSESGGAWFNWIMSWVIAPDFKKMHN